MSHGCVSLKIIDGSKQQMIALQRVFDGAPDYAMRIMGHPPSRDEAHTTTSTFPPDIGYKDKFVYGIYFGEEMVGCVDLIRGYPDNKTAMLGLLLLMEKYQKIGLGNETYQQVEKIVINWGMIEKIRIGVVGTNDIVIPFWKRMGFIDTKIRKNYQCDKLKSEHIIFEKKIKLGF